MKPIYKYFLFFLICKLIALFVFTKFSLNYDYTISKLKGDTKAYMYAANNLVTTGTYAFEDNGDGVTKYVLRMPGMGAILALFLKLFSISNAMKVFVFFQIILAAIAAGYLFAYLKDKIKSNILFVSLMLFFGLSYFMNNYIAVNLSETIAQSLFIITIVFVLKRTEVKINVKLFVISFLFAWLIFLRPFMLLFSPFIALMLMQNTGFRFSNFFKWNKIKTVFCFFSLFFVCESLWIYRNYIVTNEFIPLEYSVKAEKESVMQEFTPIIYEYIKAYNGVISVAYDDRSTSHYLWFYRDVELKKKGVVRPENSIFPSYAFTKEITIDSITKWRSDLDSAMNFPITDTRRMLAKEVFAKKMQPLIAGVKNNTGSFFQVKVRFVNFYRYIVPPFQSGKYFFNIEWMKKISALVDYAASLVFISLFMILGLFYVFKTYRTNFMVLYLIIPSFLLLLIFSFYFNVREERELYVFYPVFFIAGTMFFNQLITKFINRRFEKSSNNRN